MSNRRSCSSAAVNWVNCSASLQELSSIIYEKTRGFICLSALWYCVSHGQSTQQHFHSPQWTRTLGNTPGAHLQLHVTGLKLVSATSPWAGALLVIVCTAIADGLLGCIV
jgi:hypothetical protein